MKNEHEIQLAQLRRDTRSFGTKFYHATFRPENFRYVLAAFLALQLYAPALWPLWLLSLSILWPLHSDYRFSMPLRMPKDVGGLDSTDYTTKTLSERGFLGLFKTTRIQRIYKRAEGILYLGSTRSTNAHEQGKEMWITNSDARTHMLLVGTTGSGKTEALIGLAYNALCWGSGFCYADGKADSNLAFSLWSIARKMGREDDFLVLNYLTGGSSSIEGTNTRPQSNSMNPFADGCADFLLQLLTSMLPAASGDSAHWQKKAINMMSALITVLCYKRDIGEEELSINHIRHYLALPNMVKLYCEGLEGRYPELVFLPLKTYFETALPGFKTEQAKKPQDWAQVVYEQHGYLTGQFAHALSMMVDTYGFIFRDPFPEIDMQDVLLNNRLLVVLIPSLEKSGPETESLGKLYISAIKLMMARNLGHMLEGTGKDILDTKTTKFPFPNIIISDELSYYFAEGIAVMFAQARSLGFMMVAAVQDIQGLSRGVSREEAASMIANTKVKWTLALEDPNETYDLIRKAGGEGHYSMLAGHDTSPGMLATSYQTQNNINIQRMDRIRLNDLKSLNPGEGIVIFRDSVVPCSAFHVADQAKRSDVLPVKLNRFLQVDKPEISRLPESATEVEIRDMVAVKFIHSCFRRNERPLYPKLHDPILTELQNTSAHLNATPGMEYTPNERGIILFEAARRAMIEAKQSGLNAPYHEPNYSECEEDELEAAD